MGGPADDIRELAQGLYNASPVGQFQRVMTTIGQTTLDKTAAARQAVGQAVDRVADRLSGPKPPAARRGDIQLPAAKSARRARRAPGGRR